MGEPVTLVAKQTTSRPPLLLCLLAALTSCSPNQNRPTLDVERDAGASLTVDALEARVEQTASCTAGALTEAEVDRVNRLARDLQAHPQATVRAALGALVDREASPTLELEARLFVLLRVYFAVPDQMPLEDARFFGGVTYAMRPPDIYLVGWPVEFSDAGLVKGINVCGLSAGPSYDVVGEFDFFAERFALRDLPHD